ncbi:MAG: precorrin-3B C(17)-methyltransferase, partial [Pseudomonadota bacterium]
MSNASRDRPIALLAPTEAASSTALRIAATLPHVEVHGLAGRVSDADVAVEHFTDHIRDLFLAGRPIIGICASGILIRALAPILTSKHEEPPVIVVSEDGQSIVPLLGGHHGANRLAV